MSEYIKVNEVETVESTNSSALIVLVVSILAIVVIGLAFWQPWVPATPATQTNSTTIIKDNTEKQVPAPADSRPIIVNPPAAPAPGNTSVNIHNDAPAAPAKVDPPKSDPPPANSEGSTGN